MKLRVLSKRTLIVASSLLAVLPTNSNASKQQSPVLWSTPLESTTHSPVISRQVIGEHLVVMSSAVRMYSAITGRLLWTASLNTYLPRNSITDSSRLYVAERAVSAFELATGKPLWSFVPDDNASLGEAGVDNRALYFGTSSHRLYALDLKDGKTLWMDELGKEWRFPAVVRGVVIDRGVVYVALEQWRTENGKSSSGWLFAIEAKTGKVKWSFSTGSGPEREGFSSSPAITKDLVIGNDYLANQIVAISCKTGKEVWRFRGERGFVGFPETPVIGDNSVYAGSGDTWVYALDLAHGGLKWRQKMPGANFAYAMCGSKLLTTYGSIAVLDPRTGRVATTLSPGIQSYTSGIGVDGDHAFIASQHAIYSIGCS